MEVLSEPTPRSRFHVRGDPAACRDNPLDQIPPGPGQSPRHDPPDANETPANRLHDRVHDPADSLDPHSFLRSSYASISCPRSRQRTRHHRRNPNRLRSKPDLRSPPREVIFFDPQYIRINPIIHFLPCLFEAGSFYKCLAK